MQAWLTAAFAAAENSGNEAGVVLFQAEDPWWEEERLQAYAAEVGASETVFLKKRGRGWRTAYYTPVREIELCGHATIAAFGLLRELGLIEDGEQLARTKAGLIDLQVGEGLVWMDMAPPRTLGWLSDDDADELYRILGLTRAQRVHGLRPEVVTTGVADIMAACRDRAALTAAAPQMEALAAFSRRLGVAGVHLFCPDDEYCARCRNFAPLYGIPEEAATGTSSGALTWYLFTHGRLNDEAEHIFMQGESLGRPSEIRTRLLFDGEDRSRCLVQVGGCSRLIRELPIEA